MNFNKDVDRVIQNSKTIALEYKGNEITPEHLFLALIDDENYSAYRVLEEINIQVTTIKKTIQDTLVTQNQFEHIQTISRKGKISLSKEVTKILENCMGIVNDMDDTESIDTDVVLLSLLNTKNNILSEMFSKIDEGEVLKKMQEIITGVSNSADYDDDSIPSTDKSSSGKNKKLKLIEQYGDDVTKRAKDGDLDPVVGRKIEIKRISQILSRRKKNNPVLIGEPGVGKSAIVEGLAQRIVDGQVPNNIKDKRIFTLNMGALVAGTKYRGEFESRLRGIIKEIEENNDIILFIDEIHTIIGAGSAQGSLDASNMLKPALARGTFQCIGATTLEEYRKHIEKDGALERRFQKVVVEPTTVEETIEILKILKSRYEDYHKVEYTDEAIKACVNLTDKYMNDRFMPDKAIDAMDEAGAKVHVDSNSNQPKPITIIENKIDEAAKKKTECVVEQNFEKAASWRDKERNLTEQLENLKKEWNEELEEKPREAVTKADIAEVVSMMTKIPLDAVDDDESNKLRTLGTKMKNIVIGQDDAVDKIVRSIKRNRIGIKDPNKPVGTFMFLGSTGVGKTYLAKVLAKMHFGSEENLIRIDMSEYMEKHSVSKLIGAPPGYVGYDDGGELTEAIRRKPYSIVLLDEMEKAHPDVFNILLQILDDGILTDSYGRRVNFKNAIIIMTSNTGSRQLTDFGTGMGFSTNSKESEQKKQNAVIDKELKKKFAPEFLNRIDELVMFNSLSKDDIHRIIDLEVKTSLNRLKEIGYHVNITKSLKDFLFEEGWDQKYGARPLKRAIQRYIEDVLTDAILDGDIKLGDKVSLRSKDGEVTIVHLNRKELPPKNESETPLLEA